MPKFRIDPAIFSDIKAMIGIGSTNQVQTVSYTSGSWRSSVAECHRENSLADNPKPMDRSLRNPHSGGRRPNRLFETVKEVLIESGFLKSIWDVPP